MLDTTSRVYDFLSDALSKGEIERGDYITEQYLADNLGLSRTPVREALVELSAENILEKIPRRGYRFRRYTKQDAKDLYQLIGLLDGKVAEGTVDLMSDEDLSLMSFLIDSMDSAVENGLYTKYNELQAQFHNIYIKKHPNPYLVADLKTKKSAFVGKTYEHVNSPKLKDLLKISNDEHRQILKLFRAKDASELRHYIEDVHWNGIYALYDNWK
ncbi:GntR family transcriptional regulator [Bifidobacterium sp. ESL0763]|uniref:GntR family transcriptional regulator n=1 Tax=Bifidobacterium sp. ESL0763 TaxID=2983227 RepID=UPI0023F6F8F8|nr:GntR family transcriptional regulator [Bifidobacterium sp. ESL0763]MDF7663725.1 GntR family transcriptional regulator [Bifidobacterium sp. ESL0763]